MHKAVLHIGSNVGDCHDHLKVCASYIKSSIGEIESVSDIYTTKAWGYVNQDDFLNQAFVVITDLNIFELLKECQKIEMEMGRIKGVKWGPRIIDIDIIFYDDVIYESESLTLPHPQMHKRNFVLLPLNDLIPEYQHPILAQSISDLLKHTKDDQMITI